MKELTNINFRRYKWRLPALIALLVVVVDVYTDSKKFHKTPFNT